MFFQTNAVKALTFFDCIYCLPRVLVAARVTFIVLYRVFHCGAGTLSVVVVCGILVSQPGIEPVSPALQGVLLTTAPQEKSKALLFFESNGKLSESTDKPQK